MFVRFCFWRLRRKAHGRLLLGGDIGSIIVISVILFVIVVVVIIIKVVIVLGEVSYHAMTRHCECSISTRVVLLVGSSVHPNNNNKNKWKMGTLREFKTVCVESRIATYFQRLSEVTCWLSHCYGIPRCTTEIPVPVARLRMMMYVVVVVVVVVIVRPVVAATRSLSHLLVVC